MQGKSTGVEQKTVTIYSALTWLCFAFEKSILSLGYLLSVLSEKSVRQNKYYQFRLDKK